MSIRLGADIGGTFTDVALDCDGRIHSAKILTSHAAPEQAILDGIGIVLAEAGISPADLDIVIHGTTLATNALIERRGAKTAFVTTDGYRDVIEMRTESRFDQYDLNLVLPQPLVPREDRFTVRGRIGAAGQELAPLDEAALEALADRIAAGGYGAVAIGFLHSYVNPAHEVRARAIIAAKVAVPISVSAEVSPQMREFERFNTVCANAYVRPRMADYLTRLQLRLKDMGAGCPVCMIHSGGGLISVETAAEFPVRLIESGPAGGAIFAADIARRFGLDKVVSYDMGGTTAKICLLAGLKATAEGFVRAGTSGTIRCEAIAFMRYVGQGWEIPVTLPDRPFTAEDVAALKTAFRDSYARFFGRAIDGLPETEGGLEIEIVTWSVKAEDNRPAPDRHRITEGHTDLAPAVTRPVVDPATGENLTNAIHYCRALAPGTRVAGPAVIVERETATVVSSPFAVVMQTDGSLLMIRKDRAHV